MIEFAEPPIDAVIVDAFDNMRAYYSDDETIICTSGDGVTPSDKSSVPQAKQCAVSVSYTHLTLPTSDLV